MTTPRRRAAPRAAAVPARRALAYAALVLIAPLPALAQPCSGVWTQVTGTHPEGRRNSAMVFDTARGRAVLFGGGTGGFTGFPHDDTWEWDGAQWYALAPAVRPPARFSHAMAYDAARAATLVFGGEDRTDVLSDLWAWDGAHWTRLTPAGPQPGRRTRSHMAYDEARARSVLFGGFIPTLPPIYLLETWEWNGATWTLAPPQDPPIGWSSPMAYNRATAHVMLLTSPPPVQTLQWDGTSWTVLPPANPPAGFGGIATVYDSARERLLLLGGENNLPAMWEWDGADWRSLGPAPGPAARFDTAMTYDPVRHRVVLFGGLDFWSNYNSGGRIFIDLDDTWTWVDGTTAAVTAHPQDAAAALGQPVTFAASVQGGGPFTFRWHHDGQPVTDSARVTGSLTTTLTIHAAVLADRGVYDLQVTGPCGPGRSRAARLTVTGCAVDWDGDGVIASQDFFDFLIEFLIASPAADFNHDGVTNSQDIFDFLTAFFQGC